MQSQYKPAQRSRSRSSPSEDSPFDALLQAAGIKHKKFGPRQQAMAGVLEPWRSLEEETQRQIQAFLEGRKAPGPKGLEKLPAKKRNLSRFLDSANLTEKQHLYASLCLERGMSIAEIARRFGRHHSTIQEALALARIKIDTASRKSRSRRRPRMDD